MMALLLSYGANPYLSTLMKDSLCYSGAAQRGCYAAIAVAAAHGQRTILHKLLSQPQVRVRSTVVLGEDRDFQGFVVRFSVIILTLY